MAYETQNTIEKREARVAAAMRFEEGDRVPFAPRMGTVYSELAGISKYEALNDYRLMKPGIEYFLSHWETDLFWAPAAYPINVMEVLGTRAVRWPGATWGIDRMMGFQIVDDCYLEQEDYDDFIRDPSHYLMTKVYPRRHKKLQGLAKMDFSNFVEFGHYASMAQFADPEVRETLITLMAAGDQAGRWLESQGIMTQTALEYQTPLGCVMGQNAPYDMLGDNLRGFLELPMDLEEVPDKVLATLDILTDWAIAGVEAVAAAGLKYCFMPLHGGTDDFLSPENWERFYAPSLRKVIERELELGLVPYIFFEGRYNNRLEMIRDLLPAGILGMFEQVDIAKACKVLEGHTCVCGNLSTTSLVYGKPEQIVEDTKRMLDACAPGGGFVMDCSIVCDHFKEENFDAWYQTTLDYGVY